MNGFFLPQCKFQRVIEWEQIICGSCYYRLPSIPVLCLPGRALISTTELSPEKSKSSLVVRFPLNTKATEQSISSVDTLCPELKDIEFLETGGQVQQGPNPCVALLLSQCSLGY